MKRLLLIAVLALVFVPTAAAESEARFMATLDDSATTTAAGPFEYLPRPAERCIWERRGTVKIILDPFENLWIKWRCECKSATRPHHCRWDPKIIWRTDRYLRQSGDGWHRHRHFVINKMRDGSGWCGHFWRTDHYVPRRLR